VKRQDLAGEWRLSRDGGATIKGRLPGCTYLDYMAAGGENPFWGENETKANELSRHDYSYSREFELTGEILANERLELVADGLDTLCEVSVNGALAGKTDNINRVWRLDVKALCREGKNEVRLHFKNPYPVIEERQSVEKLPFMSMPIPGVGHIRKTPSHFGWDWGPKLPPAGVTRSIGLEAYTAKIEDLQIKQLHKNGAVTLMVAVELSGIPAGAAASVKLTLIDSDGKKTDFDAKVESTTAKAELDVKNPQLWWCNGLGAQPLYQINISAAVDGEEIDSAHRQIGLRTIELDTGKDEHGRQFRFIVNGVPIFAKGADWIPADSFITRTDRETYFFYANAAKTANMNMLRVWGGGHYECEDFYDACDACGILVWQDFNFACNMYPFHHQEFAANVRAEVIDNVRRLRHRASLALWCGNNECETPMMLSRFIKIKNPIINGNLRFYHHTLDKWVKELDDVTPYWPGSPSSGSLDHRVHMLKEGEIWGDTHLWQIWHGMRPIEAFRKFPTRFCSEFGVESMPSMSAIRSFTDNPSPELFDPVMQLHQKSAGGNEKILFYLLAKYRNPAKFDDYVYLTQLVQANAVRFATDCWRRNIGRQNGAIFWQLNDCWPVASWAGIDYEKQLKAVMYHARHFNKPLCLSNDYYSDRAEIYCVNELPRDFNGTVEWKLTEFGGKVINGGEKEIKLTAVSSKKAIVLEYAQMLKGAKKQDVSLGVRLIENGLICDEKNWLLVPDKNAALPKAFVKTNVKIAGNKAEVEFSCEKYARYVYVEAEGVTAAWSDNFFDVPAGESVTVTVDLPDDMTVETFSRGLKIKTLTDVTPKNSLLIDKFLRVAMVMRNYNYLTWLLFNIVLS
jgi:beta-mannosidase